jgi:hypothetical protein
MSGITTTGNSRVDTATAEIAVALRNASPGERDQAYCDLAMELRDEIMAGTRALPPEPIPADATPMMITDDIALNMAATVLDVMALPWMARTLRSLLPRAEGKVHGQPYQEPSGKWGEGNG